MMCHSDSDGDIDLKLISLLENGIRLTNKIDPVVHAQCFNLNLSIIDGYTTKGNLNRNEVYYHGKMIANVMWFTDGVEVMIVNELHGALLDMMKEIVMTINEQGIQDA